MYRNVVIVITAVIVLLLGATGISAASQSALPGDSLYGLKTGVEDAQLSAADDANAKAKLNMIFAQNRLSEIEQLAEQQRFDGIEVASEDLDVHLSEAALQVEEVHVSDPTSGAMLSEELASIYVEQSKLFGVLMKSAPDSVKPTLQGALNANKTFFFISYQKNNILNNDLFLSAASSVPFLRNERNNTNCLKRTQRSNNLKLP
jgi:hypothetical protein